MGYRLNIKDLKTNYAYYGTKLYGYVLSEKELPSYNYLCDIGKFNGEEIFDYSFDKSIELCYDEFMNFILLYLRDYHNFRNGNVFTFEDFDKLKYILNTEGNKIIWWD